MGTLLQDVRYSIRMLIRKPGFTVVAVIALALGIGANTAIFSVVNAVLLRPLPFPDPEQLVQIRSTSRNSGEPGSSVSFPNMIDWRDQTDSFTHVGLYRYNDFILTGGDQPERIVGSLVTSSLFDVLGVPPALGRAFLAEEDSPGKNRVVILSDGLWQSRFAADPEIIGQTLTLSSESFTVVGVMPQGFEFPNPVVSLWTPLGLDLAKENRGHSYLTCVARLKPGATLEQAQAELNTVSSRLEQQYPGTNAGRGVSAISLHDQFVGETRPALLVLLGAVGLVLLIACANVANLLLARAIGRQKEIAIRTALGAGRLRLIRQFLTESVILAVLGGGLGLLIALWGVDLLVAVNPGDIPNAKEIGVDRFVLFFTLAISVLTGLVFGLAPALQFSRPDLNETLKEGSRGLSGGRAHHRLRNALVISEIALSLVLLIGAGLLIKSFTRLQQVRPGFDAGNVLTLQVNLPRARYSDGQKQASFFQQALERIEAIPGVEAAGATSEIPFGGSRTAGSFVIEGRPPAAPGEQTSSDFRQVSPDYFRAMGIPILWGRAFTFRDTADAPGVAIINEEVARRFFPDEDPMGKRLILKQGQPFEIIAIVGNVRHDRLNDDPAPEIYGSYLQFPARGMTLAVRAEAEVKSLTSSIRSAIREVDPDQPIHSISTMQQRLSRSIAAERLNLLLLGIFAAVALVLAAVGIYSVMSYSVTQRKHEIGIRMALGAETRDVLKLVLGQAIYMASLGVAIGLGAAMALTRLMSSLLFGVSATDPAIFVLISLVLVAVALVSSFIPARRAAKVDPMVALRYE